MQTRRPFAASASMPFRPSGFGGLGGASSLLRTSLGASTRVAAPQRLSSARPGVLTRSGLGAGQLTLFDR